MSYSGYENLRSESYVAEQNALHFEETHEERAARLRALHEEGEREQLAAKTARYAGRLAVANSGAHS